MEEFRRLAIAVPPPRAEPSPRWIRVRAGDAWLAGSRRAQLLAWWSSTGELLTETRRPRALFETTPPTRWYVPAEDVRMELLEPSPT